LVLLGAAWVARAQESPALIDQLLPEFQQVKPETWQLKILEEKPLVVAVSGKQGTRETPADWAPGQLLGVFARRGDKFLQIAMIPNEDYPGALWIERQSTDSVTFATADPDYGVRSDNLKVFFDPTTFFPKQIMRYTPVQVRRISVVGGVPTITGSDKQQDYSAKLRNSVWHVTIEKLTPPAARPPVQSAMEVSPMPVSTYGQFEKKRPEEAKRLRGAGRIEEKIGPFERAGTRLWVGKTFYDGEGSTGVGDLGYFDQSTGGWTFLELSEMADWSASALLVEQNAVWVGLVKNGEGAGQPGGLLRYDRVTHKATKLALPDVVQKIVRVGKVLYCGTSGGFATVEGDRVQRFEFSPQVDGSYTVLAVGN
jgi:hypothetical protein